MTPTIADVVRRFGPAYRQAHGAALLPSHRRTLDAIVACRTERLGGQLWRCPACALGPSGLPQLPEPQLPHLSP